MGLCPVLWSVMFSLRRNESLGSECPELLMRVEQISGCCFVGGGGGGDETTVGKGCFLLYVASVKGD